MVTKIAIIGAGFVGATTAYAFMLGNTAQEIVLIDKNREKAIGEAMDLSHGAPFVSPVHIYAGDYADCRGAKAVVITAGAAQMPGQSRLQLTETNSKIIQEVVEGVLTYNPNPILIVVTNPVDIMAYVAWKVSRLPASRVIGSGTVLDTSRFRHLLSKHCCIDPRNIHAYVIGEHGDSEVLLWNSVNLAGISLEKFCSHCSHRCSCDNKQKIEQKVREAAYEVIRGKKATYYAVALALRRITESILRDERSILTVSTFVEDIYGVKDLFLSLPCILGKNGVENIVPIELNDEERHLFLESAKIIKNNLPFHSGKAAPLML